MINVYRNNCIKYQNRDLIFDWNKIGDWVGSNLVETGNKWPNNLAGIDVLVGDESGIVNFQKGDKYVTGNCGGYCKECKLGFASLTYLAYF